jgi:hypothetical protein
MASSADAIVVGEVVGLASFEAEAGHIRTAVQIALSEVIKGERIDRITLIEAGGRIGERIDLITAAPQFSPGERVFLFLERRENGTWGTFGMALGKFSFVDDERPLLLRWDPSGEIFGWSTSGEPHREWPRHAAEFLDFLRETVTGNNAVAGYFADLPPDRVGGFSHFPPSAYLMIAGGQAFR